MQLINMMSIRYIVRSLNIFNFYLGKPSEKKNRKIYDIEQMGGWVANSKHDFFSIKNYDIIKGGWVTDFHVIIFKLSFFHKSPYDFPFF